MDEPLWGDFKSNSGNACSWSFEAVAKNAVVTVDTFREYFPNVQVGDIEPLQNVPSIDLAAAYTKWLRTWRQTTGEPLAFFHVDVLWGEVTPNAIKRIAMSVKESHVRFGIIYNGDAGDNSNQAWLDHAVSRYTSYEEQTQLEPDDAVFQSWNHYPSSVLPEEHPGTHTNLVLKYMLLRGLVRR